MVVSELRGEKIDIIPWNNEPARFIAKALSPARVREVFVDDDSREATVVVPNDQLALAIGKEGLNARLAARLTGWKVDIQSDEEFAAAEADAAFAGDGENEEYAGRCAAVLSNGKRCPNASLPGTRYCGVPAHQALAQQESALPADAAVDAPVASAEEVEELEPVARIEEPGGDAAPTAGIDATPETPQAPERAEPDLVPAGIPVEPTSEAEERLTDSIPTQEVASPSITGDALEGMPEATGEATISHSPEGEQGPAADTGEGLVSGLDEPDAEPYGDDPGNETGEGLVTPEPEKDESAA
jgi:N utilization substance protein A